MITIDLERCTGCGACLEVCPTRALFLVDGKAMLDSTLCRECEACLGACPCGAITLAVREETGPRWDRIPAAQPQALTRSGREIVPIGPAPAPSSWTSRALPMFSAAVAWAGREILPWLTGMLVDRLDRQTTRPSTTGASRGPTTRSSRSGDSRRRSRYRRRGGRC